MDGLNTTDHFKSSFPEDFYLPAQQYEDDYYRRTLFGMESMSKLTLTIGILIRDAENIVNYTILRALRIGKMFNAYKIVILENDSKDRTRDILEKANIGKLIGVKLPDTDYQQDKSVARRRRMAICRNALRAEMQTVQSDYYMVIDGDVLGGYSYEGIANSFSYPFDVCGSNSLMYNKTTRHYYDSWAFRDLNHPHEHYDCEINPRRYERGEPATRVLSCFGGLAIYANRIFHHKAQYNDTDCDHVTLHKQFPDTTNIIMNPSQICLYNKSRYVI